MFDESELDNSQISQIYRRQAKCANCGERQEPSSVDQHRGQYTLNYDCFECEAEGQVSQDIVPDGDDWRLGQTTRVGDFFNY